MTHEDAPGGPGLGYVIAGSVIGVVVSLAAGPFVAASLNTWLSVDWARRVEPWPMASPSPARCCTQWPRSRGGACAP
jgi:hypothetical protein